VSIVASIIIAYSLLMKVPINILTKLHTQTIIIAVLLMAITPIFNGLRMAFIAEAIGIKSKSGAILARAASQFAALISPGTTGAYIIKAYWVKRNKFGWGSGLGIALTESFFDSLIVNSIVTIIAFIKVLEGNLIVLPVALIALSSLVNSFILFGVTLNKKIRNIIVKLMKKFKIGIKEEYLKNFGETFLAVIKKPKNASLAILFTLISLTFQSFVVIIVADSLGLNPTFFDGLIFIAVAQVMGGLPSPGGAVAIEFGTTLFAKADLVFSWRVLTYVFAVIYHFIFFQIFIAKYVKIFKEEKETLSSA